MRGIKKYTEHQSSLLKARGNSSAVDPYGTMVREGKSLEEMRRFYTSNRANKEVIKRELGTNLSMLGIVHDPDNEDRRSFETVKMPNLKNDHWKFSRVDIPNGVNGDGVYHVFVERISIRLAGFKRVNQRLFPQVNETFPVTSFKEKNNQQWFTVLWIKFYFYKSNRELIYDCAKVNIRTATESEIEKTIENQERKDGFAKFPLRNWIAKQKDKKGFLGV